MKLIIDISKEDFEIMKHNIVVNNPLCPISQKDMVIKIANGIPLPKGHGRLKDVDALYKDLIFPNEQFGKAFKDILDDAPTVIEADVPKRRKGIPIEIEPQERSE